ncbi:DUF2155 domain-containing protein [Rhodovibrio salinarum]|uniref:DUF2155 domain-containing protein n=1 Tax=Rhodovibrio salinarum TaxID=1087 RepID=A0A934QFW1_9PROT|nr:DUF2155 domain-containing protein [Rhodovibrio salinarum]MBK1695882.1 DUF2155 domain-containing protein [Rhodovibrio salinarum]
MAGVVRCLSVAVASALCTLALAGPVAAAEAKVVVLQGLDKVTARTDTFEVPVGSAHRFGTLEITVDHCWKAPPEEPPENKAFLEIVDIRPDREPKTVFTGWMFSSSPALNALEHPVYDVWVETCKMQAGPSGDEDQPPKPDEVPGRSE